MRVLVGNNIALQDLLLPHEVDGGWAYWGEFGECSEECGGGEKVRERTCTHPAPRYGGADCEGDAMESMACNEDPCPGTELTIQL